MAAPKKQRVMQGSSGGQSYEEMLRSVDGSADNAFEAVGKMTRRGAELELKNLEDGDPRALMRRREFYEDQKNLQDKLAAAKTSEDPRTVRKAPSPSLKDSETKKFSKGGKVEKSKGGEVLRGCRGIQVSGKGFKGTF